MIEVNDKEINVEEIVKQMKIELGAKGIIENIDSTNISYGTTIYTGTTTLKENIDLLNRTWNVSIESHISSHRKLTGNIIVIGKKVIRKLLRWYVKSLAEQQTEYNANVTRAFNSLLTSIQAVESENNELKREIMKLRMKQDETLNKLTTLVDPQNQQER